MTVPKLWNIGIHAAQSYLPNEQLLFCYALVTLQILSGYCLVTGIFSWFGVTDLFGTFKSEANRRSNICCYAHCSVFCSPF